MTSKIQKLGDGKEKCRSFRMCLNLKHYLFKTNSYSYRSAYMNCVVTTNQISLIDTQKLEKKEHKHTTKENHQTTREETIRRRNVQK